MQRRLGRLAVAGLLTALGLSLIGGRLGDGPEASAAVTQRRVAAAVARDGLAGTFLYRVQAGDTLTALSRRFETPVTTLQTLNGITDPNAIRSGAYLNIPESVAPAVVLQHGSRSTNTVALTFDMGGRVDPALDIMDWLLTNNIPATVFLTGAMIENLNTDAGRQVLAIIAANPSRFSLGNHSATHPDFTTLPAAAMEKELRSTEASIAARTTLTPLPYFRPPFGAYDARVLAAVGAAGYRTAVMWDIDTVDWRPESDGGPTAAQITAKVLGNAQGGSVVLMHLGGYNTLDALPGIVSGLRARGFTFVRLTDLAR